MVRAERHFGMLLQFGVLTAAGCSLVVSPFASSAESRRSISQPPSKEFFKASVCSVMLDDDAQKIRCMLDKLTDGELEGLAKKLMEEGLLDVGFDAPPVGPKRVIAPAILLKLQAKKELLVALQHGLQASSPLGAVLACPREVHRFSTSKSERRARSRLDGRERRGEGTVPGGRIRASPGEVR